MFFSVKEPIKITGKTYIPCVCYSLPKFLELTVNDLVNKGKAVIYAERVFFQNGKVIEKETKTKKAKKIVKKVVKTPTEKEAEEAGLPTELNESEGF